LARNIKNKLHVIYYSFAHLTLTCCYTTLWNAEIIRWPFTTVDVYW